MTDKKFWFFKDEYNWLGNVVKVIDLTNTFSKSLISRYIVVYDKRNVDTKNLTGVMTYGVWIENGKHNLHASYETMEHAMIGMLVMEKQATTCEDLSFPIMKMIYGQMPDDLL